MNATSKIPLGSFVVVTMLLIALVLPMSSGVVTASDHADPVDPLRLKRLEPGITDLFLFPVMANEEPASPFKRNDKISLADPDLRPRKALTKDNLAQMSHMVIILCVRRGLTESSRLKLERHTYRVHIDLNNTIAYENQEEEKKLKDAPVGQGGGYQPISSNDREPMSIQEARCRYGGMVGNPNGITAAVTITVELKNDASLKMLQIEGLSINGMKKTLRVNGSDDTDDVAMGHRDAKKISVWTGVRDDPFIFPAFFKTNVVSMVFSIPIACFPADKHDWLIWANSHEGNRQLDHVGRSLRTQNPRFEILNTLHPGDHVNAIKNADENPSLVRDLGVRLNVQGLAAYRKRWDFVPDVMVYKRNIPVGFPNGRLLYDDVAALLAQHGDTLLLELSHQHPNGGWPRRATNDKPFFGTTEDKPYSAKFPYLAEPWPERDEPEAESLTPANQGKIVVIVLVIVLVIGFAFVVLDRLIFRRRSKDRSVL